MSDNAEMVIAHTVNWLEKAVIGLNLCPFAKRVHTRQLIHYAVSTAVAEDQLLESLRRELLDLNRLDAVQRDTTLLIAPNCLKDFLEFNDFLDRADALLCDLGLEGVFQIASFHPDYQFAGTQPDDVTNCTNRSPYPTLHLLRESSLDEAVQAFPEPEAIYEANIATLRALGVSGWVALDVGLSKTEAS